MAATSALRHVRISLFLFGAWTDRVAQALPLAGLSVGLALVPKTSTHAEEPADPLKQIVRDLISQGYNTPH